MENLTNEEIIDAITKGDDAAFNALYEKYHRMVYYIALKTMHSESDAKDVLQDTFLQIHKSIGSVKNPQYLQLWISRITVNKCNLLFRKRRELLFEDDDHSPLQMEHVHNLEHLPEKHLHFQNDKEVLSYFINRLSDSQRLMIVLMYYEGFSIQEIAHICDIPEGTVKSRLKTARDNLKGMITLYERESGIPLNFQAESLPLLIGAACISEIASLQVPHLATPFSLSSFFTTTASKTIGLILGSTLLVTAGAYGYHQSQQKEPQKPLSLMQENTPQNTIKPEIAYYRIMMWANTEDLLKQKQDEISAYQKYYDILNEEHEVYWDLLLKSDIQKYFE